MNESIQYQIKYAFSLLRSIDLNDYDIQKLGKFFRDYDLKHRNDYLFDFCYFLLKGEFYDWTKQNNYNSLRKDVNEDFYKGFNE